MSTDELDDVDREILYRLQQNARDNTAADIAEYVGVTANTVRNRIERLEAAGILTGYVPTVNYESAGYQLVVCIRCTAAVPDRTELAEQALQIDGVVSVRELMTGRGNVVVTVAASESDRVTRAATEIQELGLQIEQEELVKDDRATPFSQFAPDSEAE